MYNNNNMSKELNVNIQKKYAKNKQQFEFNETRGRGWIEADDNDCFGDLAALYNVLAAFAQDENKNAVLNLFLLWNMSGKRIIKYS